MAKVAFLGLGVMGYPMAGHLKTKGGHEVTVYNRTAAKAEKWATQHGGRTAATPKAAAEGQDFVLCCVGMTTTCAKSRSGRTGRITGCPEEPCLSITPPLRRRLRAISMPKRKSAG